MLTMLESLNYSFRNPLPPKKRNLSNLPHQTVDKLQKNHGVLRGPLFGKQRWRARLGIFRVKRRVTATDGVLLLVLKCVWCHTKYMEWTTL